MKKALCLFVILLIVATVAYAQERGVKKKRPLSYDYGKVVMNNTSEKNKMAPVVFGHWLHRSKFTCRVCHVDIGFGMKEGTTGITAADNMNGLYCGTCHNGRLVVDDKKVFPACSRDLAAADRKVCDRCHAYGKNVTPIYAFSEYTAKFPRERFGNGVDWEKAEKDGLIRLIDYVEGVSISRKKMQVPEDFALDPKAASLPEIIFSHEKHTVWNGCEVCHPEIFTGVKKGATHYSMVDIFNGKFCGVCHGTVAFPNIDCQRCHIKQVS